MAIVKLISVVLAAASVATAVPTSSGLVKREDVELFERGLGEMVLFKRDNVLTPRDMELAELHGVNISQMWKHSVMKRSDGDDYTFWVDNSFTTEPIELPTDSVDATKDEKKDSSAIEERQQNLRYYVPYQAGAGVDRSCHDYQFRGDTGPSAPYTGGILHMATWARRNRHGRFMINSGNREDRYDWRTLFVAGSNSGANAAFRGSPSMMRRANGYNTIGASDIELLAVGTNTKFAKKFGGAWRARAWGPMWCDDMNSEVDYDASHWHITNTYQSSNPFSG